MSNRIVRLGYAVVLAGCVAVLSAYAAGDKIVIAHRGASGYLPEHTLESYTMGYALGADYIEPDLAMTKDGLFVCMHDNQLERTTDVKEKFPDRKREDGHWYVADFVLSEIKELRNREYQPKRFPTTSAICQVPTFEEVIELVQGLNQSTGRNVGIYPELKSPAWHRQEGLPMEEAFLKVLDHYGYRGKDAKIFVQCFEAETLKKLRNELKSELPQIFLVGDAKEAAALLTPEGLDAIRAFAEGIGPAKALIEADPGIVKRAHERGLVVHPYTFRSDQFVPPKYGTMEKELTQFYFTYDVDGVFTDFPDKAVRVLASGKHQ